MNTKRRERLRMVVAQLEAAKDEIESVQEEEDEARDNMPESLQETDRYFDSENASDAMGTAAENIAAAIEELEEVV